MAPARSARRPGVPCRIWPDRVGTGHFPCKRCHREDAFYGFLRPTVVFDVGRRPLCVESPIPYNPMNRVGSVDAESPRLGPVHLRRPSRVPASSPPSGGRRSSRVDCGLINPLRNGVSVGLGTAPLLSLGLSVGMTRTYSQRLLSRREQF